MGLRHPSYADLTDWAEGEPGTARRAALGDHLQQCQRCALAVHRVREASGLAGRLSAVAAPTSLRALVADSFVKTARTPLSCAEAAPLLQEHIDGCLSPGAGLLLRCHLDSCAECRAGLAALAATAGALRELPDAESPARVRHQVFDAARRRSARPAVFAPGWKPALAAACAVLLLAVIAVVRPANKTTPQHPVALSVDRAPVLGASRVEVARSDADSLGAPALIPVAPEAGEPGGSEEAQPGVVAAAPRPVLTGHRVSPVSKGPEPARVTPETAVVEVTMPSALRALRVVASSATYDVEVQRAMELAEDQYATLHSEALFEARLARLPAAIPEAGRADTDVTKGEDAVYPSESEAAEEGVPPQPRDHSGPSGEGAALLGLPLV